MSKFKEKFEDMLTSPSGDVSSKRVITFVGFILCSIAFIANIFFDIPLKDYVWDGMLTLVGAGLGFVTIERFAKKNGE